MKEYDVCQSPGCENRPQTPRHRFCSKQCRSRTNNAKARAKGQGSTAEYRKEWRAENLDHARQTQRAYYVKNKEKLFASQRAARAKNPEKYLAASRRRYAARPYQALVAAKKVRAKAVGFPFDLDMDWATARWTGRCELSGIEFRQSSRPGPWPYSPTIDRVIPDLGYIKSNCRFILHALNAARSDGTDEDLMAICRAYISFQCP